VPARRRALGCCRLRAELVESGTGDPFAPSGSVFGEWVSLPQPERDLWQRLVAEALEFVSLTES